MAFKLGNTDITDVKLGNTQVNKVYKGSNLVWEKVLGEKILSLDFQNNFTDSTGKNTMVAGFSSNLPTFVAGRKGTDYAANFNGSQSIKTVHNLALNSDKVSISFWAKGVFSSGKVLLELGATGTDANIFAVITSTNSLILRDRGGAGVQNNVTSGALGTGWNHIVMTIDRSLSTNKNKIYVNGVLNTQGSSSAITGNYANLVLHIGGRGNSALFDFTAQLQEFKIYNYPLSQSEIIALYTE